MEPGDQLMQVDRKVPKERITFLILESKRLERGAALFMHRGHRGVPRTRCLLRSIGCAKPSSRASCLARA